MFFVTKWKRKDPTLPWVFWFHLHSRFYCISLFVMFFFSLIIIVTKMYFFCQFPSVLLFVLVFLLSVCCCSILCFSLCVCCFFLLFHVSVFGLVFIVCPRILASHLCSLTEMKGSDLNLAIFCHSILVSLFFFRRSPGSVMLVYFLVFTRPEWVPASRNGLASGGKDQALVDSVNGS